MKKLPLGIYYLLYSNTGLRCNSICIVACTRDELFSKIIKEEIPDEYLGFLEECRTPGKLVQGNINQIKEWAGKHMPNKYGEPLL